MRILGRRLDLSANFFGVTISNQTIDRDMMQRAPTNIEHLPVIVLQVGSAC